MMTKEQSPNRRLIPREKVRRGKLRIEIEGDAADIICREVTVEGLSFKSTRDLKINSLYPLLTAGSSAKVRIIWKTMMDGHEIIYGGQFLETDRSAIQSLIESLRKSSVEDPPSKHYQRALTLMNA